MKFIETKLKGAYVIEPELLEDERGFFTRAFCQKEFEAHGMNPRLVQGNISYNKLKGTLRGMHYQVTPMAETKLIRCTKGAIFDVIVDLRPESPTYCQWVEVELNADNHRMLYIPEGFAHGYQAMEDETEIFYLVSEFYSPENERGVRWDDPVFGIRWPLNTKIISKKDKNYPLISQINMMC